MKIFNYIIHALLWLILGIFGGVLLVEYMELNDRGYTQRIVDATFNKKSK